MFAQPLDATSCGYFATVRKSESHRPVVAAGEADESGGMFFQFFFAHRAFVFG